ncbi:hypothetical protein [Streptomyces sp. NPDC048845]|uniref:hypothetical protein n=1 Tax=Streptomyces sp. NPDC048845 TaxID=3155390 RepID=UPI00341D0852
MRPAAGPGRGLTPGALAGLQSSAGNAAVVGLLAGPVAVQRAVMDDRTWQSLSKHAVTGRSAALKAVDAALTAYHGAASTEGTTDEELHDRLSTLAETLVVWRQEKQQYTGGPPESGRADAAERLASEVEEERRALTLRLREGVPAGEEPGTDYRNLAVYQAGAMLSEAGAFTGASADERRQVVATMQQTVTKEADVRIAMMRAKITEAHRQFRAQGAGADTVGLFTAPEWYFKRPGTAFSRADKDHIVNEMLKLSAASPGMLIVPGSIVWGESSAAGTVLRNGAVAVMNGRIVHETTKRNESADVSGYHPSPEEAARNKRADRGLGARLKTNFERAGEAATDSSTFTMGNLTVSLEICLDHDKKRALEDWKNRGGPRPHLQILVSAGSRLGKAVVRNQGVGTSNDALDLSSREREGVGALRQVHVIGERRPDTRMIGPHELEQHTPYRARPAAPVEGAAPAEGDAPAPVPQDQVTEQRRLEDHADLQTLFMGIYRLPG